VALAGSELIVHAGDVAGPEVLDALRAVAPVVAVRFAEMDLEPAAAEFAA
jgi:predicted phosphodiesterase